MINPIAERLRFERDMFKLIGFGSWLVPEFVLRYGQECTPQQLPKRYRMQMPKACFWNTQRLVNKSKVLRYAEGYVYRVDLPLLISHAWAVDRDNKVVDTTLSNVDTGQSDSHEAQYFGVVFEPEIYRALKPRGGGSFFDSGFGYRIDLLIKFDPAFEAVIKEASATKLHPNLK